MSWKVEIKTPGDKDWVSNALRFASMDEAKQYGVDLDWRWTIEKKMQFTKCDDPVNVAWRDGGLIHLRSETDDESASAAHG